MEYGEFLKTKRTKIITSGFEIERHDLNPGLFEFQKDLAKFAIKKGKSALFANTGTGKTQIEAEFLYQINKRENKPVLLLCPLAVAEQWKREVKNILGYESYIIENQNQIISGINITNYEKLHKFDVSAFEGVALDESSVMKSFNGKTRDLLIEMFKETPYKLAATATPAPNDYMELGNHAEFLNVMSRNEMLSMYFIHDSGDTAKWRLKKHAVNKFWEFIASWAAVLKSPGDLGYDDERYNLLPLNLNEIQVKSDYTKSGLLFNAVAKTLTEKRQAKKASFENRMNAAIKLVNKSEDKWMIWCELNAESDYLKKNITDGVEVKGADKDEYKKKAMLDFADNKIKCLVSKAKICGFGLNFQNCHNVIFVGLSDSFEQYYQAVRRCWRFGQEKIVNVYIITSEQEKNTINNINRKERDYEKMMEEMGKLTIDIVKHNLFDGEIIDTSYNPKINMKLPKWL